MAANDVQHEAMRVYHALVELRPGLDPDWGGGLVLLCGPGCVGGGAPAAVSIAGGTTLAIDSDAAAMKSAMRAGYLDFVVNTLDEALRALKNEVRKRRPLGVGLIADVDATLAEMIERGVQPDLEIVPSGGERIVDMQRSSMSRTFSPRVDLAEEPGASPQAGIGRAFGPQATSAPVPVIRANQPVVCERHAEYFFAAASAAELAAVDAALLAVIAADDAVRRRWIQRVPQYLREARSGGRWIWLSDEERERLATNASAGEGEEAGP
jgi:urocanate hydratase